MKDVHDLCDQAATLLRQTLDVFVSSSSALEQHAELLLGAGEPLTQMQRQEIMKFIQESGQKIATISEEIEQAFASLEARAINVESDKAEMEERLHSMFLLLENLGHEMRMPMSLIRGYSDVLLSGKVNGPLTTEQAKRVKQINRLSQDLLAACVKMNETKHSFWIESKALKQSV